MGRAPNGQGQELIDRYRAMRIGTPAGGVMFDVLRTNAGTRRVRLKNVHTGESVWFSEAELVDHLRAKRLSLYVRVGDAQYAQVSGHRVQHRAAGDLRCRPVEG